MWLRNTSSYPTDEVRRLVELATADFDMRRVCVNVKGGKECGGYAYDGVPDISNAPPTAEYLVTIRLPKNVEPITWNERRSGRWPVYRTKCWRELLVVIAAHEGKHIEQYRDGVRRSEVKAERNSHLALSRYQTQERGPGRLSARGHGEN